jgi:carbamoylphosphate synthase large subunit
MPLVTKYNRTPFRVAVTIPGVGEVVGKGRTYGDAHEDALRQVEARRVSTREAMEATDAAYRGLLTPAQLDRP